jgi:hypothetical protein
MCAEMSRSIVCLFFLSGLTVGLVAGAKTTTQQPQLQQTTAPPSQGSSDWDEDEYVPIKSDGKNSFDWKLVKVST